MSDIIAKLRQDQTDEEASPKGCKMVMEEQGKAYPCADDCPCALRDLALSQADRIEALEAERDTAIAAAYEAAARSLEDRGADGWAETVMAEYASVNAEAIRAMTPADAIAARDADRARVRRDAWLECADWIEPQRNDRPANGSEFAAAIRAMIEEEGDE